MDERTKQDVLDKATSNASDGLINIRNQITVTVYKNNIVTLRVVEQKQYEQQKQAWELDLELDLELKERMMNMMPKHKQQHVSTTWYPWRKDLILNNKGSGLWGSLLEAEMHAQSVGTDQIHSALYKLMIAEKKWSEWATDVKHKTLKEPENPKVMQLAMKYFGDGSNGGARSGGGYQGGNGSNGGFGDGGGGGGQGYGGGGGGARGWSGNRNGDGRAAAEDAEEN